MSKQHTSRKKNCWTTG